MVETFQISGLFSNRSDTDDLHIRALAAYITKAEPLLVGITIPHNLAYYLVHFAHDECFAQFFTNIYPCIKGIPFFVR